MSLCTSDGYHFDINQGDFLMKFTIKNAGVIKKAEIEFGDLTILCGKNNTGKTYVTYNAFNYIDAIRYFLKVPMDNLYAEQLLEKGKISIPLEPFFKNINKYIETSMEPWVKNEMARQMAAHEDLYKDTNVSLFIEKKRQNAFMKETAFNWSIQPTKECKINVIKEQNRYYLDVLLSNNAKELPEREVITQVFSNSIIAVLLKATIPDLFIITCERTGAAAFRTNFVISQSISSKQENIDQKIEELYQKMDFRGHPRPMNKDLEFVCRFDEAIQKKGYIAKDHPEIIDYFSSIVGGEYRLTEPNIVTFVPSGTNTGLTMLESSSSVRSLMELNFYLKHKSKTHQCLIIDEPELNLHPENQRKIARLLAMLVNAGVYVAITTHSDYILREIDFMISLSTNKILAKKLGYSKDQLLRANQVKSYVTDVIKGSSQFGIRVIPISDEDGIRSTSFDDTIKDMNDFQQAIKMGDILSEDDFVPVNDKKKG